MKKILGCFGLFSKKSKKPVVLTGAPASGPITNIVKGGAFEVPQAFADENSMEANLTLAEVATRYAKTIILASNTLPTVTASEREVLGDKVKREVRGRNMAQRESINELFAVPNKSLVRMIKRPVRAVKLARLGNCGEFSDLVLNYLRKKNVAYAEKCTIIDETLPSAAQSGHVIVVIGRDPRSDTNKPETWGKNAVICDAWANKYYPVSEIYDQLQCYRHEVGNSMPNVVYPYTKGGKEKLIFTDAIKAETNEEYQKQIIKETVDKITMMQKVVNDVITSEYPTIDSGELQTKLSNYLPYKKKPGNMLQYLEQIQI